MLYLVNYADRKFRREQKLSTQAALKYGKFDEVFPCGPRNISLGFYNKNRHILRKRRGAGYWLWKPYIILQALEQLREGDFLFYSDTDTYFVGPVFPLIPIAAQQGIVLFHDRFLEKHYTKRDVFTYLNCDSIPFTDTFQRNGGMIFIQKRLETIDFFKEFLFLAENDQLLTDKKNKLGESNYPGFQEHRHDQSLLSLLSKKRELAAYSLASQRSMIQLKNKWQLRVSKVLSVLGSV